MISKRTTQTAGLTVHGVEDGDNAGQKAGNVQRRGLFHTSFREGHRRDDAHGHHYALGENLEKRPERWGRHVSSFLLYMHVWLVFNSLN